MIDGQILVNIDDFHYENTYKRLAPSKGGKQSKDVLFKEMWEVFVWSAVLGYLNKAPKPIEKRTPTPPFRWQVIKEPHQKVLAIMAVEATESFDILQKPDELRRNIEEHSNAGLVIMHEQIALDRLAYQNIENIIQIISNRF